MKPTFGERLKELRLEHELTQLELAKKLFIAKSSICKYEKDNNFPEASLLQKIADYFNVSVDYLLGKSDQKNYKSSRDTLDDNHIRNILLKNIEKINGNVNEKTIDKAFEIIKAFSRKGINVNDISSDKIDKMIEMYLIALNINKD